MFSKQSVFYRLQSSNSLRTKKIKIEKEKEKNQLTFKLILR